MPFFQSEVSFCCHHYKVNFCGLFSKSAEDTTSSNSADNTVRKKIPQEGMDTEVLVIVAPASCAAVVILKAMVKFPQGRRVYINRGMKVTIPLIQTMCCG